MRVALLGFLPWSDPTRAIAVRENPSALAAERCAAELSSRGIDAAFVPVAVSEQGIRDAVLALEGGRPHVVVAAGQTPGGPRVERFGRVPGAWSPARADGPGPWLLAPDAAALARALNRFEAPFAEIEPFGASDDAGGYYCDHLCVELARFARANGARARFLHLTAIDGVPPRVRDARVATYARRLAAVVAWLTRGA